MPTLFRRRKQRDGNPIGRQAGFQQGADQHHELPFRPARGKGRIHQKDIAEAGNRTGALGRHGLEGGQQDFGALDLCRRMDIARGAAKIGQVVARGLQQGVRCHADRQAEFRHPVDEADPPGIDLACRDLFPKGWRNRAARAFSGQPVHRGKHRAFLFEHVEQLDLGRQFAG